VAPSHSDHVSDLHAPWTASLEGSTDGAARGKPAEGAVYSWCSIPGSALPGADPGTPSPARSSVGAAIHPEPPRAAATPGGQAGQDELLQALLQGLAVPELGVDRLTPELMLRIGEILRASTQGAVELLSIRAALKRELRAGVTVINARDNNSLKFSPSGEAALRHLLGPATAGFMPPVDSVRDAFEDLRAHELAVMAGMKAALAGVLERFDPSVLEGKLAARSGLSGLIPSARKARLWNLFEALYRQLAEEAAEDFDTLFGKAFLRAYEEYLRQVRSGRPTGEST
jgi:type VI secretion system FHA domain protein